MLGLRKLRQEDHELMANLGYIVRQSQKHTHTHSLTENKTKQQMERKVKVAEHLPTTLEALGSIPSDAKAKKKNESK